MKILNRNKQKFYYCLYDSTEIVTDEYGNETGEKVLYKIGVPMYANISPATGLANTEQFGNLEDYDKVIVTDDMSCPIDEHTVLFIDKQPEYKEPDPPAPTLDPTPVTPAENNPTEDVSEQGNAEDETEVAEEQNGSGETESVGNDESTTCIPVYDYIVKRVAKSLNVISIAVSKVKVT